MEKTNKNFTYLSILITYLLLIFGTIIYFNLLKDFFSLPKCPFYTYFGIYCPACGCTRAVISLSKFDFITSITFNPIILYVFIVSSLYLIVEGFNIVFKTAIKLPYKYFLILGLIILIINWIIKNILIFKGYLL